MKSLSAFLKTTIVGGALYLVPIALILVVLGKVHAITSKLVAPWLSNSSCMMSGESMSHGCLQSSGVVLICFLAGLFARTAIAQQLVGWLERAILSNLPGYSVVSTLGADIAGTGDAQSHMQVVLADDRFKAVDVRIPQAMKCIKGLGVGSRELLAGRL